MKYILHDMEAEDAELILAARAARHVHRNVEEAGHLSIVSFGKGLDFQVNTNKASISVWHCKGGER